MVHVPEPPTSGHLVVPELLQGQWSSALILTFGADLGFFESRLLSQLAAVPLRVILADDERLNEKFTEAAETGQSLRRANRTYVAAAIRHSGSAHAKVILLTAEREGVLVVGSGNLGHDGYASPGELWNVFRYHDDDPRHLSEFVAIRGLLTELGARGLLDPPVVELLQDIWGTAPWIPEASESMPDLHHNLDVPLIDQLVSAIDEPVEDLVMHAPFHDADSAAASALIRRLSPAKVTMLVSKKTSVDPQKLRRALRTAAASATELVEVRDHPGTYIHAKWIHAVGAKNEVLLTGSANLSRAALLNSASTGNIEVGVIRRRTRGAFDSLYTHLVRKPIPDAASLGLRFQAPDGLSEPDPGHPILLWSRLDRLVLTLAFDRDLPTDLDLALSHGGVELAWTSLRVHDRTIEFRLRASSAALVAEGGAIRVRTGSDDEAGGESWPFQLSQLRSRLEKAGRREQLTRITDLPEKDAELMQLLQELEQTLIFDAATTWRVVKPDAPTAEVDDGETIAWEDLDWNRVRRDPRFVGYLARGRAPGYAPTDVQVLLAAIAGRLGDIGALETGEADQDDESELAREGASDSPEDAEEREDELEDELTRRSLPVSTRVRMAFNRFVRRYARAARDVKFVNELGPLVAATNAVIFSNLLGQLLERNLADPHVVIDARLAVWEVLWGTNAGRPSILDQATEDEREEILSRLNDAGTKAECLRAMAETFEWELDPDLTVAVREQVRYLISDPGFGLRTDLLEAIDPSGELSPALLGNLVEVAAASSRQELDDYMLEPVGLTRFSADWEKHDVRRPLPTGPVNLHADILVVRPTIPNLTPDKAREVLERMAVARYLNDQPSDYLRVRFAGNGADVGIWDEEIEKGLIILVDDHEVESDEFNPPWPAWLQRLEELQQWAEERRGVQGAA